MRLVMIAAVAVLALAATAALAQEQSATPDTVGSGTAKVLEPGPGHMVGKPVAPSTTDNGGVSQRRRAVQMPQPGSVPRNGTEKPAGTTGAPPYGGSDEPHGG